MKQLGRRIVYGTPLSCRYRSTSRFANVNGVGVLRFFEHET
jgi:hypothetical protein